MEIAFHFHRSVLARASKGGPEKRGPPYDTKARRKLYFPRTTSFSGASPSACQLGRYMDSTVGGGTRYLPGVTARAR
ncbi:hypothetical protein D3C85_866460 [compost metagenome]